MLENVFFSNFNSHQLTSYAAAAAVVIMMSASFLQLKYCAPFFFTFLQLWIEGAAAFKHLMDCCSFVISLAIMPKADHNVFPNMGEGGKQPFTN